MPTGATSPWRRTAGTPQRRIARCALSIEPLRRFRVVWLHQRDSGNALPGRNKNRAAELIPAVGGRHHDRVAGGGAVVEVGLAGRLTRVVRALLDAGVVDVLALQPAVLEGHGVVAAGVKTGRRQQDHRAVSEHRFGHLYLLVARTLRKGDATTRWRALCPRGPGRLRSGDEGDPRR